MFLVNCFCPKSVEYDEEKKLLNPRVNPGKSDKVLETVAICIAIFFIQNTEYYSDANQKLLKGMLGKKNITKISSFKRNKENHFIFDPKDLVKIIESFTITYLNINHLKEIIEKNPDTIKKVDNSEVDEGDVHKDLVIKKIETKLQINIPKRTMVRINNFII